MSGAGGREIGVEVSSSHIVSAVPSCSGGGLLTLFPCPSVRSLSQETVLQKLLQHEPFPRAAGLHELPQHGSLLQGAVLQEQAAPAWVPHGVTSPVSNLLRRGLLGPQVLAGACSITGSPWGHSLLQASTCSGVGSLPRATGGYLLHYGPLWAAGEQPASLWSSSRAVRENSLLQHLEHLLPSLFTNLGVCRDVSLTSSHSSLSTATFTAVFFPFLNMLPQRRYHCR